MFRYGQLTCAAANISVQIQNRNENDKQIDETTDKRSLIDNTVQQEKIDEKLFGKLQAIQSEQSKCPHINDKEYDTIIHYHILIGCPSLIIQRIRTAPQTEIKIFRINELRFIPIIEMCFRTVISCPLTISISKRLNT